MTNQYLLSLPSWSPFLFASFICLLLALLLLRKKNNNNKNLPPGPLCLPLIGNLHLIRGEFHILLFNLAKKYGDIYRLQLGEQLLIVVSGRKLFSQMLVNQSVLYSKRPEDFIAGHYLSRGQNFVFASEMTIEEHKKQKAIAAAALKKTEKLFSTNFPRNHFRQADQSQLQSSLETVFSEEAVRLGRQLVKLGEGYNAQYRLQPNGKYEYTKTVMNLALCSSNRSMATVVLGKRFLSEEDEEEAQFLADLFLEFQTSFNNLMLYTMFPFIKKVWKKSLVSFRGLVKTYNGLIENYINEAKKSKSDNRDQSNNNKELTSNSVLDAVLQIKAESHYENWNDLTTLSLVQGIFGAGVDTFSSLSRWLFIYFGIFSEKTKRAQNEVDKFVDDHHRLPRYSDRNHLPYVMAYLTEVMRHSCFVPFTVPHSPAEDTTLGNYSIPKKASVLFSFMSLNWDPSVFCDSHVFRPERFIAEDNSFNKALADKVNVHGAGRRVCAGMNMSKIQGFVSIASLLHTFDCKPLDKDQKNLPQSVMAISTVPKVFNVQVCERNDLNQQV